MHLRVAIAVYLALLFCPAIAAGETAPANLREVCSGGSVLNLRASPSPRARVIDVLPDEFDLLVVSTNGTWLKVRDESGRTGWVAKRFTCAPDAIETASGPWQSPAPGACVTSPFGPRKRPCGPCSRNHRGIDLGACGTPVLAAASGRVLSARFDRRGGNMVVIDHGSGVISYYLHLKSISVKPKQAVAAGVPIGIAGRTGAASTGCHLHFEVRKNGKPIDPQLLLAASTRPPAG